MFREWLEISEVEKPTGIKLQRVADGFVTPTAFAHDGKRIYITDQVGKIFYIENGKKKLFLDISSKFKNLDPAHKGDSKGLNLEYDERGLLGLAFHPQYQNNGRIFIYRSDPKSDKKDEAINHDNLVCEYSVSSSGNLANTEKILLRIPWEGFTHNGGDITFGPDGYLYIPTGDGGCCNDENHGEIGHGQSLSTLKGKILRIDINGRGDYSVPSDNPFSNVKGARPEIYAYGLRNPWKISFDGKRLFAADVGESKWESIFIIKKGGNHGWVIREGTHYLPKGKELIKRLKISPSSLVDPIHEYSHDVGSSIIGGYVYRGKSIPELIGHYVFGDWSQHGMPLSDKRKKGSLFYLKNKHGKWTRDSFKLPENKDQLEYYILGFGEDFNGELYVLCKERMNLKEEKGVVFKLIK